MYGFTPQQRVWTGPQAQTSFFTNFPATENPLAQGGIWVQRDPFYTKIQTIPGFAYGTETGNDGFNDSYAYMPSWVGNNYSVEGTIWLRGGLATAFREVQLWMRASDTTTSQSVLGYAIDIAWDGQYAEIGTFANGNIATLITPPVPVTGDKFKVQIVGQTITYFWNGVAQQLKDAGGNPIGTTVTDNGPNALFGGSPGFGFFIQNRGLGAVANDDFRLQDLRITAL